MTPIHEQITRRTTGRGDCQRLLTAFSERTRRRPERVGDMRSVEPCALLFDGFVLIVDSFLFILIPYSSLASGLEQMAGTGRPAGDEEKWTQKGHEANDFHVHVFRYSLCSFPLLDISRP